MSDQRDPGGELRPDLREELLSRRDVDQTARSSFRGGGLNTEARLIEIDDDNAAWLTEVVEAVGWPGRSLVGDQGAQAAWLLALHADRYPALQRRCLKLLEEAVAAGEASPADLAYLTDRVLMSSGESQVYGTQLTARGGQFVACRLRDPETVDDRRASVGLEPLEASLRRALDRYGPPMPARARCPNCHEEIDVWLPEMGGRSRVTCPSCHSATTIRARMRSR